MYKQLISSILVISLLNLLGCYSHKIYTGPEYKQAGEKYNNQNEICVITKDDQEYNFPALNYYFENDTLYGEEERFKRVGRTKQSYRLHRKIALSNIESIEIKSSLAAESTPLVVIIVVLIVIVGISSISINPYGN